MVKEWKERVMGLCGHICFSREIHFEILRYGPFIRAASS